MCEYSNDFCIDIYGNFTLSHITMFWIDRHLFSNDGDNRWITMDDLQHYQTYVILNHAVYYQISTKKRLDIYQQIKQITPLNGNINVNKYYAPLLSTTFLLHKERKSIFLTFLADTCPFWGPWYPCFGFLVISPLGFKARVGSALFTFLQR